MPLQNSTMHAEPNGHLEFIQDDTLLARFLSPNMLVYFCRKRPDLTLQLVRRQLAELLKFLILVRDFPGNIIFGPEIDEMWHLWIMQTRDYEGLCAALPGGEFRHHSSRDYPEQILAEQILNTAQAEDLLTRISEQASPPTPPDAGSRERFEQNAQRLLSFFASYYSTFGPLSDDIIPLWPPLQRLSERLGWTSTRLNTFLAEQVSKSRLTRAQTS